MTVQSSGVVGPQNGGASGNQNLGARLNRLDGSVTKDDQFSIKATTFDANGMKGSIGDSKGSMKFEYDKTEGAYGSIKLSGQKHVFSHNNYMVLRAAIEARHKNLQKKA